MNISVSTFEFIFISGLVFFYLINKLQNFQQLTWDQSLKTGQALPGTINFTKSVSSDPKSIVQNFPGLSTLIPPVTVCPAGQMDWFGWG